jgi:hypothetical protein
MLALLKPVFDKRECEDGIMLVTPRPGVNRENLVKTLQSVYSDAYNLRGGGGGPPETRMSACWPILSGPVRLSGCSATRSATGTSTAWC